MASTSSTPTMRGSTTPRTSECIRLGISTGVSGRCTRKNGAGSGSGVGAGVGSGVLSEAAGIGRLDPKLSNASTCNAEVRGGSMRAASASNANGSEAASHTTGVVRGTNCARIQSDSIHTCETSAGMAVRAASTRASIRRSVAPTSLLKMRKPAVERTGTKSSAPCGTPRCASTTMSDEEPRRTAITVVPPISAKYIS